MSIQKTERNQEIVKLINQGISYRALAKLIKISLSRVEGINRINNTEFDKAEARHCVRCGAKDNLMLGKNIRNICSDCVDAINSL